MNDQITVEEAFRAMIVFLDRYYERGGGKDTLGHVLGDVSQFLWADGSPNDPAQWQDWLDAVKSVRK
ncbi:MAG: hypothetical protein IPP88_08375 [Betaproteobacteria bacterium]|nr:hypothetical protein [Betaproteobacteria bacterium]